MRAGRASARVVAVNVGTPREIEWRGEIVTTAIWKSPIDGLVAVRGVNLAGDEQADRTVHGGADKAVYAYAVEDYRHWADVEGMAVSPALFGENLTVEGIDLRAARVGERWRIGTVLLEVAQPRLPCYKLGIRVGDRRFVNRFLAAGRLGAYLRIVEPGELRAGDTLEVVETPNHDVSLALMGETVENRSRARALGPALSQLPPRWRRLAEGG